MHKLDRKDYFLFVDLDGTLIHSDLLLESFFSYFSKNIFAPLIAFWILTRHGVVELKRYLYKNSNLDVNNLPYNKEILDYIKDWRLKNNGKVILISASDFRFVDAISKHLGFFDESYGTETINLKSQDKLNKINELVDGKPFGYIGNSSDDIILWRHAELSIAVEPSWFLKKRLQKLNKSINVINKTRSTLKELPNLIRIHQWVKNLLIFVPSLLAGYLTAASAPKLISGFLAFSVLASAFYILNDLFDVQSDRNHSSKQFRSIASGGVSIKTSIFVFLLLILSSILISFQLSLYFQITLIIYGFSTFFYSKYLKKFPIVDIFTLAYLYVLRIIAGGLLVSVPISNWLITFSVFFFLFLATVKRWIEIKKSSNSNISGRGYLASDKNFASQLSYFSGLISILIVCLYIESNQAQDIYSSTRVLWFIPLILLFWVVEILFKVERGEVNDDPVVYALKSKTSYLALGVFSLILFIALN